MRLAAFLGLALILILEVTIEINADSCAGTPCSGHGNCTALNSTVDGRNFSCACNPQYQGPTCSQDVNECENKTHNCDTNAQCINVPGGFNCTCKSGFQGNGSSCTDVDECSTPVSHNCDPNADCTNFDGGFNCTCKNGYTGNGTSCADIDECATNTSLCDAHATCRNYVGGYNCTCRPEYSGNGTHCKDIDECATNTSHCHAHATCNNSDGGYTCTCKQGYSGNGTYCEDIDECTATNTSHCHAHATCNNSDGGYNCTCKQGYSGNGTYCEDIDVCVTSMSHCHTNATCSNYGGSYNCTCKPGYAGNGTHCEDIDECATNMSHCHNNATCSNFDGGYTCTCKPGYSGNGTYCEDIDVCVTSMSLCHTNATCSNYGGSYNCTCKPGYAGNGTHCEDINECASNMTLCHANATCSNFGGGYECLCISGYSGNGTFCKDVDECKTNATDCHGDAICVNNDGGFQCLCKTGFSGNGTHCEDINECSENPCLNNGTCVNKVNDYECNCTVHWTGKNCSQDLDECTSGTNTCDVNADCTNAEPGFSCKCKDGFEGNGTVCSDIDECKNSSHDCHHNATCTNTMGGFNCSCVEGYIGNGTYCEDVDECKMATDNCHMNATCKNLIGQFECTCKTGYNGNGTYCEDMDECDKNEDNCHSNATCTNEDGTYRCDCKKGYSGNGTFCQDIDECVEKGACHDHANCTNTIGSYTCKCNSGFEGNGTFCTDIQDCLPNPCQNNGYCRNLEGRYECLCEAGWSGQNCTEEMDMCSGSPCKNSGTCNNFRTSYNCSCSAGFKGVHCETEIVLYNFDGTPTTGDDDLVMVDVSNGVPICGKVHRKLYVSMNGYVVTHEAKLKQNPPGDFDGKKSDTNVVAPFWSDMQTVSASGLYVQAYNTTHNAFLEKVKTDLQSKDGTFQPHLVVVATWSGASPYPASTYAGKEDITFQVAMVTDYKKTYTIFNYDPDLLTWKKDSDPLRRIFIGYSCESSNPTIASEAPYTVWNQTNTDKPGRFIYEMGPVNDLGFCNAWYNEQKAGDISQSLELSFACPCTTTEADVDSDFSKDGSTGCYDSDVKNNTKQRCCYDSSSSLLIGYPGGGYITTMMVSGDNSTEIGYKACCEGTLKDYCGLFYQLRPSDTCIRYSKGAAKPPAFKDMPKTLTVTLGKEFVFQLMADPGSPNGSVTFKLMTDPVAASNFSLVNNTFTWTPMTVNESYSIKFIATDDTNNLTALYWPNILLCNCGDHGACQSQGNTVNKDRFYIGKCSCQSGFSGEFCEKDPCSSQPCYPGVACTVEEKGYKCASCPQGLVGNGIRCNDENECALGTHKCSQTCVNTVGGYQCACQDGYLLDKGDNKTCTDVNECIASKPCDQPYEFCSNTEGSYKCNCKEDYLRKGTTCEKASVKFVVSVALKEGIPGQKWDEIKNSLSAAHKNLEERVKRGIADALKTIFGDKFVGVKVLSMSQGSIDVETGVYFSSPDPAITGAVVKQTLVNAAVTSGSSYRLGQLELDKPADEAVTVKADACKLSSCDAVSTVCVNAQNGGYQCQCKPGFEYYARLPSMCQDIDECLNTSRCANGACINTPGDYLCKCKDGFNFDPSSKTCINTCDPSKCKNGQCLPSNNGYYCKCKDGYTGRHCEDKDTEADYLRMVAITVGAVGAGVILLLVILLIVACCRNTADSHKYTPSSVESASLETWNPNLPRPHLVNNPQYEMREKHVEEGHYDERPSGHRSSSRDQGIDNQAYTETEVNGAGKRKTKKDGSEYF